MKFSSSPAVILRSLLDHRELMWALIKRDFIGRYKGSIIGVAWSFLNPLLLLSVYAIFFSVVFKARWDESAEENRISFAVILFAGMIVHGFFSECINRAPGLIVGQTSYVKKVVFPLEVLPLVTVFSALLHFLVSLSLLLAFCVVSKTPIHIGVFLIPVVMLPILLISVGLSWIFASLGVYLRDISQIVGFVSTVLLFLSPVFFKVNSLPEEYQRWMAYNPLTLPIEQLRSAMLWGCDLDWVSWGISLFAGILTCQIGFWWFQKSRKGFADVI